MKRKQNKSIKETNLVKVGVEYKRAEVTDT